MKYNNEKSKNNKMLHKFPLLMETTFWALAKCLNLLENLPMKAYDSMDIILDVAKAQSTIQENMDNEQNNMDKKIINLVRGFSILLLFIVCLKYQ